MSDLFAKAPQWIREHFVRTIDNIDAQRKSANERVLAMADEVSDLRGTVTKLRADLEGSGLMCDRLREKINELMGMYEEVMAELVELRGDAPPAPPKRRFRRS